MTTEQKNHSAATCKARCILALHATATGRLVARAAAVHSQPCAKTEEHAMRKLLKSAITAVAMLLTGCSNLHDL